MSASDTAGNEPIRAGVFSSVDEADQVIHRLIDAGIPAGKLTVVCSDELAEHFRDYNRQLPAGSRTFIFSTTGAVVGAAIGGGGAAIGNAWIAQVPIAAAIGIVVAAIVVGGMVGGFIGAMVTRGTEKELANFHAEGLSDGKIVVAVEDPGLERKDLLQRAAAIFDNAGVASQSLPQG